MPFISVVVPCFNQERFLSETLASLRAQTLTDWECIVVNDGSTDNSLKIAEDFQDDDSRFRVVQQENRGMSSARNAGIGCSRGDYLYFLDADDRIHAEALNWLASAVDRNAKRVGLIGSCSFISDPESNGYAEQLPRSDARLLPDLLAANLAPIHCFLARRSDILEVGAFDETLLGCEDWGLWLRLALHGAAVRAVPRVGAYYRRQPGSMSADSVRMLSGAIAVQLVGYKALADGDCQAAGCDRQTWLNILDRAMRINSICLSGSLLRHGERELAADFVRLAEHIDRLTGKRPLPGLATLHARYRRWRYSVRETTPAVLAYTRKLRDELHQALQVS